MRARSSSGDYLEALDDARRHSVFQSRVKTLRISRKITRSMRTSLYRVMRPGMLRTGRKFANNFSFLRNARFTLGILPRRGLLAPPEYGPAHRGPFWEVPLTIQ